jgi:hypothetical protein
MSMITLDYDLSPEWNRRTTEIELRSADETTLRYDCFLGDAVFVVDGADFSARWGWVPVLDFALGLRAIAGGLVSEAEELFEFTESDAAIEFRRQGDTVRIEADYASAAAEVRHVEFSLQAEQFVARVVADLTGRYPDLASNPFVVALSRGLTTPA